MLASVAIVAGALGFLAFVLLAILASRSYSRFLARLQSRHPATWRQVGSPSMQSNEADEDAQSPSSMFFWKRQYRDLPDPELHQLGDRARTLSIALLWALGLLVVVGCLAAVAL